MWAVPFATTLTILCVRNRLLFGTKLYEQGDAAANSILITRATHFGLLVGNYSREGFHHPGPGYMYLQAFGQLLYQDTLHLVPTAWNAHLLAVFTLNSACVAAATAIVYGWSRSIPVAAAGFAAVLALGLWQPWVLNSDWMPDMYVLPYLVLLLAAASVAAGGWRDAWILTFTGWLLIHGHVSFLFFVPLIVGCAVALACWRLGWRGCLRKFRAQRSLWLPVTVISALFALPIALELALHWPGYFGDYLTYGKSGKAGGHSSAQILHFLLWFWWPHGIPGLGGRPAGVVPTGAVPAGAALAVALLLLGAALVVALLVAAPPLRPFLLAVLVMTMVSTVALIVYAAVGIDNLAEYYIGYFYWTAPVVTIAVIVTGVVSRLPWRVPPLLAGAGLAVAACVLLAVFPGTRTATVVNPRSAPETSQQIPGAVATLAARAAGRTVVLDIQHDAWPEAAGLLVQAQRSGVPACVDYPALSFLFTSQPMCTPAQLASGAHFDVWIKGRHPAVSQAVLRLGRTVIYQTR